MSAFHDLPAEEFPFRVEFWREDTGEVVHVIDVDGPGVITVPPLGRQLGVRVGARIVRRLQVDTE